MKTYSIIMTVAINVTVTADTLKEAKLIAMGTPLDLTSEFDRRIDKVEDITPVERKVKRGIGSY